MADELQVGLGLDFKKGSKKLKISEGGVKVDVTGGDYYAGTQVIGTTAEAVKTGNIAATGVGYALVKNLDTSINVTLRNGSGGTVTVLIPPGEIALFRMAEAGTLYAAAASSTVEIEYTLIEA